MPRAKELRLLIPLTEGFRRLLPDDYEYVFLDGEKEHPPAPAVEKVFPGPFWSYLTDYAVKSMAEQHEFVLQAVRDEGTIYCGLSINHCCPDLGTNMVRTLRRGTGFQPSKYQRLIAEVQVANQRHF